MHTQSAEELTFRHRLEIIVAVLERQPLRTFLDRLTPTQLVQAHEFLWSKLVELHYQTQPREFQREDVTRKMLPSARYQKLQNCDLRLDYCKGVECIWAHPHCAGNKVINNMEVMAEHIFGFFAEGGHATVVKETAAPIIV
ncbi:hypothetical protein HUU05_23520 [candidate division KSB1 bacterium]|nr:hypothetical protein [candidate division KSB1 bacterium]